jgi:Lrp/AsnC family leucine-responsive transcriptional regulator
MSDEDLDATDRAILQALQEDARHNSNAAISERVGVSASTVGKRITALENRGVIEGYHPEIDYEAAGYPLHVLFLCTVPITRRAALIEQALGLQGVVNVRELMTGEANVHIEVTGRSNDDITRIAHEVDEMGFDVADEILLRNEHTRPSVHFEASGDER